MALVAGVESAVQLHIARGDGLNDRDHNGQTPLMIAASANRASLCHMLLAAGADPTLTDNYGRDAVHIARIRGSDDARTVIEDALLADASLITDRGTNFGKAIEVEAPPPDSDAQESDEPEETATRAVDTWIAQLSARTQAGGDWARERGFPTRPPVTQSALRDHLARGEDIDVRDGDGRTALMIVAALNKPKMCRLLVEAGANPKLLNNAGKDILDIARAHQAEASVREIERAVARAASTPWATPAFAMSQLDSVEPVPEQPEEPAVDFGEWVVEAETTAPATDGAILTRAMEIQRAIADHVPIDAAAEWDAIVFALPHTAEPAPEVNERPRSGRRPPGTAVESLADALAAWGGPAGMSNDASDGAPAPEAAAVASLASDATVGSEERRATTWEAIRRRNEEAAKRKREGVGRQPAMDSPSHEEPIVVPSWLEGQRELAAEIPSTPSSRPWPTVAPVAAPASSPKAKTLPLGAVLASVKRAGFNVHGIHGEGQVVVAIHAANDTKSRNLIRQLVEHGFEYRPMVGYCK